LRIGSTWVKPPISAATSGDASTSDLTPYRVPATAAPATASRTAGASHDTDLRIEKAM
jgi:hypothetical protein